MTPTGDDDSQDPDPGSIERIRQVLIRAVERHCPPVLTAHREDLVQMALVRLLERPAGEGTTPRGASYLWRVAYTVVIDEIRRLRRQQRQAEQLAGGEGGTPGPEARSEFLECLGGLQDRRRSAVTLHLQGFRVGEVAAALGWTEKQAENLVYRGLADLRACLEGGET
ncbi:MAG TPA: sigma factor-like helix-turn-helix DNA-binding protein [Myxococcaceae bacterium]|nr:sigma factor-like helix-turn-helix DNA-binding protein [Myxococcaceae bacterium]